MSCICFLDAPTTLTAAVCLSVLIVGFVKLQSLKCLKKNYENINVVVVHLIYLQKYNNNNNVFSSLTLIM